MPDNTNQAPLAGGIPKARSAGHKGGNSVRSVTAWGDGSQGRSPLADGPISNPNAVS